jgi:hypothetical protein
MDEATPEDLQKMARSRAVLEGWERVMLGRPEDHARMIQEEIAVLQGFVKKYPRKADTLGTVIERYRKLLRMIEH